MTGILAYGSLIHDPGEELSKVIVDQMNATTPFNVEFARISSSRKGAPTLVPVESGGAPVDCRILILDPKVDVSAAKDMLWRRETRTTDRHKRYLESTDPTPNQVLIKSLQDIAGVGSVLYVDFASGGKIKCPTAQDLGARAIESARRLANDHDGITYLNSAIQFGIQTPLTNAYRDEILHETGAADLQAAREMLRGNLDTLQPSDALHERDVARYQQEMAVFGDELVYLHSNLSLVSQIARFDAHLFEAPVALLSYLSHGLATEAMLICSRLWRDKPKGSLTLERFTKWLRDSALLPELRPELDARIRKAAIPSDVEALLERMRGIRHVRLAHLGHAAIRGLSPPPNPVRLEELQRTANALGAYFNVMAIGSKQMFVTMEFYSRTGEWYEGELGFVLDRIALGSKWLTVPDEAPEFWPVLRLELSETQLTEINKVRERHGKPPVQ